VQGIMSCLNAFSGSVFLTVGLAHLIPDVLHYQAEAFPAMAFPLGLALVALGFLLILFIEQVVFDVHGTTLEERERRAADAAAGRGGAGAAYSLLDRTLTLVVAFREPLLTELALVVHATLEAMVLGLAVRPARRARHALTRCWLVAGVVCQWVTHVAFTTQLTLHQLAARLCAQSIHSCVQGITLHL
jgi:hypothetical protein